VSRGGAAPISGRSDALHGSASVPRPFLECVEALGGGQYVAHFGYESASGTEVTLTPDIRNSADGSSAQPPMVFQPGRVSGAFLADFGPGAVTWTLGNRQVTATAASRPCVTGSGRVAPKFECVAEDARGGLAALFSVENSSAAPMVLPRGPQNRLDGSPTEGKQPTTFLPGMHEHVLAARLDGEGARWSLGAQTATAIRRGPRCNMRLEALAKQDTGVDADQPDVNFGSERTVIVGGQRYYLLQFDRAGLKARIGSARFVTSAELVIRTASGQPAHWAPALEALPLAMTWTESNATWNCAHDHDLTNDAPDCELADAWSMEDETPWRERSGDDAVIGEWRGSKVSFDVTADVQDALGSVRVGRDLGWILLGADDAAVTLASRESHRPPRLILHLATSGDVEPLVFDLDPSIVPVHGPIDPIGASGPRPVAAVVDPEGVQSEFVADELLIDTNDEAELARFLADWDGEVLSTTEALPGSLASHIVRIDPSRADPDVLAPLALTFDNRPRGVHRFSSAAGRALLAAAAQEIAAGVGVGVNWVGTGTQAEGQAFTFEQVHRREILEGPNLTHPQVGSNTFDWPHLTSDFGVRSPPFGVTDAWLAMYFKGKLTPGFPRVAIIDKGFNLMYLANDLPSFDLTGTCTSGCSNNDLCGGDTPCPWHGTDVAVSGFGQAGNEFGVAGPGGPVSDLELSHRERTLGGFKDGISEGIRNGAYIVSISSKGTVPATLTFTLGAFNSYTDSVYRYNGRLIFAGAGNDGEDVDAEHCFLGCWEARWHFPCENDGVVCVGGMRRLASTRHPESNYGKRDVVIFGPYITYAGGPNLRPGDPPDAFRAITGTSVSTPFVAGVAALTFAAQPQPASGIWRLLKDNASTVFDSTVPRVVNARRSVFAALGVDEIEPLVRILSLRDGSQIPVGRPIALAAEGIALDGTVITTFHWESDRAGVLDADSPFGAALWTLGTHRITATGCAGGLCGSAAVTVQVVEFAPEVVILQPATEGQTFPEGLPVRFQARVEDDFFFPCEHITWSGDIHPSQGTVTGCVVDIQPAHTGVNVIRATAFSQAAGLTGFAERLIVVGEATNLAVHIVSPAPGDDGLVRINVGAKVLLHAEIVSPSGGPLQVGWFFNTIPVASGQTAVWDTAGFTSRCGGVSGDLAVLVMDELGNIAGHSVRMYIFAPVC
jgi:serine protease